MVNTLVQKPGEVPLARLFVGGKWVETGETLPSLNPATGLVIGQACVAGPAEVAAAVAAARAAQRAWAEQHWPGRRRCLAALRQLLLARRGEVADVIVQEVGKPRAEAVTTDILPSLELLAYYIRHTGSLLARQGLGFSEPWYLGKRGAVQHVPLGVIAVITPWNYPLSLAMSTLVPALAVGNSVVFKPSEEVPLLGALMARLFAEAGFPPGVVNVINGPGPTGRALVNAAVDKVAFTGSPATARRIYADLAGSLRPATMELGGKDPMIVLDDADVEYAARGAVYGAFVNCGQTCAAVERAYVLRPVAAPFSARVTELVRELRQGNGGSPRTDLGPLVSSRQRQVVAEQVTAAVAAGARVLAGGEPVGDRPGFFYAPTVLADVNHDMAVMREETFGPVLAIMTVDTVDEAINLANDSPFGLCASVWTRNLARGRAIAGRLQAAMISINDHASHYGKPTAPWGGRGDSGYGRVHGPFALAEFTYPQLIVEDPVRIRKFWWYPYGKSMLEMFDCLQEARHAGALGRRLWAWARLVPVFLRFLRERR